MSENIKVNDTPSINTRIIRVDTVSSSKGRTVKDLRSLPTPRSYVGPWNMSSVEPDMNSILSHDDSKKSQNKEIRDIDF